MNLVCSDAFERRSGRSLQTTQPSGQQRAHQSDVGAPEGESRNNRLIDDGGPMSHWFMFDTASVITQDNGIQVTIEWSGTGVDSIDPLRGNRGLQINIWAFTAHRNPKRSNKSVAPGSVLTGEPRVPAWS